MVHVGYQFNSPSGTNRCGLYACINTVWIATNAGNGSRLTNKLVNFRIIISLEIIIAVLILQLVEVLLALLVCLILEAIMVFMHCVLK